MLVHWSTILVRSGEPHAENMATSDHGGNSETKSLSELSDDSAMTSMTHDLERLTSDTYGPDCNFVSEVSAEHCSERQSEQSEQCKSSCSRETCDTPVDKPHTRDDNMTSHASTTISHKPSRTDGIETTSVQTDTAATSSAPCAEQHTKLNTSTCDTVEEIDDDDGVELIRDYLLSRKERFNVLSKLFQYPCYLLSTVMKAMGTCRVASHDIGPARAGLQPNGRIWLEQLSKKMQQTTFSTSFSGIDTPNVAAQMMSLGTQQLLGGELSNTVFPKNIWACEIYSPSQQELLSSPNGPTCLFANIETFWKDAIGCKTKSLHASHQVDTVLVPLVMTGEAVKSHSYCLRHGRQCKCQCADIHIAGTPCVAYSPRGNFFGLDDITVLVYLCWIAMRRHIQEPWVVQENVQNFPSDHLKQCLDDIYEITSCIINPLLLGWPVSRVRKYHVLRHREKTTGFACHLPLFHQLFVRDPMSELTAFNPSWSVFMVAESDDLHDELRWAATRPGCGMNVQQSKRLAQQWMTMQPEGAYFQALTTSEREALLTYIDLFPNQAYQLNQRPSASPTHSSSNHMFTLIKNAGIIWSFGHVWQRYVFFLIIFRCVLL